MIAVAIIGTLAAIGIPSFVTVRNRSIATARQTNVRRLNHAVQQWAMDALHTDDVLIDASVLNYIKGGIDGLSVGGKAVSLANITTKTVGHKFAVTDLY